MPIALDVSMNDGGVRKENILNLMEPMELLLHSEGDLWHIRLQLSLNFSEGDGKKNGTQLLNLFCDVLLKTKALAFHLLCHNPLLCQEQLRSEREVSDSVRHVWMLRAPRNWGAAVLGTGKTLGKTAS